MSGTSLDGVDALVVDFAEAGTATVVAHRHVPYPAPLREQLLNLQQAHMETLGARSWALLDQAVAEHYVEALLPLARRHRLSAVGMHGQTVFHDPLVTGNSLQLGNPNRVVAALGVPVVADFRRADIAEGGQGAPLVPGFHRARFGAPGRCRGVVNIGGIANLTRLGADGSVSGHDLGPGNALMDEWMSRHQGTAYDADGLWAGSGTILPDLLAALKRDPWFKVPAPRSTGRDQFSLRWVERRADGKLSGYAPADVQRTLLQLSAELVAEALGEAVVEDALICGGGARNGALMAEIQRLAGIPVQSTAALGLDPQQVEPAAFAWLARERMQGRAAGLPSVTGARRAAVLGGVYLPA
jgi:anhydro-N-acetylmuramic acid kinase